MRPTALVLASFLATSPALAQHEHHATDMPGMADAAMGGGDSMMGLHMRMTPRQPVVSGDSARAKAVVTALRDGIARYADPRDAEEDGFKQFAPQLKNQRVYHWTSKTHAFGEAFRFDPAKPTSLLYTKSPDGKFHLVGAMYTMPKNASLEKLNARVPLSIAQWHQHINWCLPKRGDQARWTETRNGHPLFGPLSPIATPAACDSVGGDFHEHLFGWMVHVNAFASEDPKVIWADEH